MRSFRALNKSFLIISFFIGIILNTCPQRGTAQIKIAGPVCAVPGITYLYRIEGNKDSIKTLNICVTGGTMLGIQSDCYTGKPIPFIKVQWNKGVKTGSISLASGTVNSVLNVEMADSLNPGTIDSSIRIQQIKYNTVPDSIDCMEASGGSCSPAYRYQWQVSSDATHWSSINGSTGRNIIFSAPLKNATFYRREVIETKSGSVSYSNIAAVYVKPAER
jgi:hypothetical protein